MSSPDYKPPSRLSTLLRSDLVYWGALTLVAIAAGLYAIGHL
jgi:hypothetical protein